MSFVYLTPELLQMFWKYRNLSMKNEVEYCGALSLDSATKTLVKVKSSKDGMSPAHAHCEENNKDGDWTGCYYSGDFMFTWHTHPILFSEDNVGRENYPFIPSDEDILGYLQDSAYNKMFLSNDAGNLVYDFLLTPAGIMAIGAGEKALELYKKESGVRSDSQRKEWLKAYGMSVKNKKMFSMSESDFKETISKKSWAPIENSYNHERLIRRIGGYSMRDKKFKDSNSKPLWNILSEEYEFGGYGKKDKKSGAVDWEEIGETANKTKVLKWFNSKEFLQQNMLRDDIYFADAVEFLRKKIGLEIHYFPWSIKDSTKNIRVALPKINKSYS